MTCANRKAMPILAANSRLPAYAKEIVNNNYALEKDDSVAIEKVTVSRDKRRFYLALHRIADEALPEITEMFTVAVGNLRSQAKIKAVQIALEAGDTAGVLAVLGIDNMGRELEQFTNRLRKIYEDSSVALRKTLPKDISAQLNFDLLNESSVQRLREYGGALITGITEKTRQGILDTIEAAFRRGGSPFEQARQIRNSIGLTPRQATAVDNFRAMLIAEGRSPAQVKRMTDAYYNRQLTFRARTIARTETIRASNAGQREIWNQASEQGLLDANTVRRGWVITPDDRLCPICEPIPSMNPDGVPLNGMFDTPVGPLEGPPAHPNCRCAEAIIKF